MSHPDKAIFLSYTSQDAEAAKRICEALCAAGVGGQPERAQGWGGIRACLQDRKRFLICK